MPPTYSSSQRTSIAQFVSFTQAKESVAAKGSVNYDWNVERAIDSKRKASAEDSPVLTDMSPKKSRAATVQDQTTSMEPLSPVQDPATAASTFTATEPLSSVQNTATAASTSTATELLSSVQDTATAVSTSTAMELLASVQDIATATSTSTSEQQRVSDVENFLHFVNYVNNFYSSNNTASASTPVQQHLNKLFDTYRDSPQTEPDKILIDGAQSYLSDLSIAVDEVVHFALCDLLDVESIGEFKRKAFVSGWLNASTTTTTTTTTAAATATARPSARTATAATAQQPQPLDTIPRQSAHVSLLRKRLTSDPAYFKTIYRAAFKFAKPEHQRSVPLESALEFWKMFFSAASGGIEWNNGRRGVQWLDLWLEFYETQGKRPVNKDLWNMVGELVLKTKEEPDEQTIDGWRADGAWPFAIDDFIAWDQMDTT
ncbi:hypothetical protein DV737_g5187, partial [Chaetothyriales sp. CBS 132003]